MSDNIKQVLSERNALSLAEAAKHDRETIEGLRKRLQNLEGMVAMQQNELTALRQMIVVALAQRGHGATSRS